MPKRSREDDEFQPCQRSKHHQPIVQKRKNEFEEQEPRKRQRSIADYVDKLEKDNEMMRGACFQAGEKISALEQRVKELELFLSIQSSQIERIRLNNNITVY